MPHRRHAMLLIWPLVLGLALPALAAEGQPPPASPGNTFPGSPGWWRFRSLPARPPSGSWFYPEYVKSLEPWHSARVGVPAFHWGYFGVQPLPARSRRHTGYYDNYRQWTWRRGL